MTGQDYLFCLFWFRGETDMLLDGVTARESFAGSTSTDSSCIFTDHWEPCKKREFPCSVESVNSIAVVYKICLQTSVG